MPYHRYHWLIKCVKGTNFKIGIATAKAKENPNAGFSDTTQGLAFYSTGTLRHDSKGSGAPYGESFSQGDIIGVYCDFVSGIVFFSKNGTIYNQNAFVGGAALRETKFYPAASCLTKNEMFELLDP